jgi:hypothetical protein
MSKRSIVLDDHGVVLNDLLLACQRSANHFARAVEILEKKNTMATWFETLRNRRQKTCNCIKEIMGQLAYLPKEPDPDKETVLGLATRAQTLLSIDERTTLVVKAIQMQTELETHLKEVRKLEWSAEISEKLNQIDRDLYADKERLGEAIEPFD